MDHEDEETSTHANFPHHHPEFLYQAHNAANQIISFTIRSVFFEASSSLLQRIVEKKIVHCNEDNDTNSDTGNRIQDTKERNEPLICIREEDIELCYKITERIGNRWQQKMIEMGELNVAQVIANVLQNGKFLEKNYVDSNVVEYVKSKTKVNENVHYLSPPKRDTKVIRVKSPDCITDGHFASPFSALARMGLSDPCHLLLDKQINNNLTSLSSSASQKNITSEIIHNESTVHCQPLYSGKPAPTIPHDIYVCPSNSNLKAKHHLLMKKEVGTIDKLCSTSNYTKKRCRGWEIVQRVFKKIQERKNYSFSDEYTENCTKNDSSGEKNITNRQENDVMFELEEATRSAILCNTANIHPFPVQSRQASSIGMTSFSWEDEILPTMSLYGYDLLEHQTHNNSEQHQIQGALKMLGSFHLYEQISSGKWRGPMDALKDDDNMLDDVKEGTPAYKRRKMAHRKAKKQRMGGAIDIRDTGKKHLSKLRSKVVRTEFSLSPSKEDIRKRRSMKLSTQQNQDNLNTDAEGINKCYMELDLGECMISLVIPSAHPSETQKENKMNTFAFRSLEISLLDDQDV